LVIETEYDNLRGGWSFKEEIGSFEMGVWKHTRREWENFFKSCWS